MNACDNCGKALRQRRIELTGYQPSNAGGLLFDADPDERLPLFFCSDSCFRAWMRLELKPKTKAKP